MSSSPYSPLLPDETWSRVRDFVTDAVEEAFPLTPYTEGELYLAVSRLAIWSRVTVGPDLPRERVLALHNIERFIHSGMPGRSQATKATIGARLRRVSEVLLNGRVPGIALELQRASKDPIRPYASGELAALISWATTLSTAQRRNDAAVLIGLGLGAGLTAAEVGAARVRDLSFDREGVSVIVSGERDRVVPVFGRWELLLVAQASRPVDEFLFRPRREGAWPNLISNFVTQSPGAVRPQTQRMRSTWIVEHLNAWVPPALILEASGIESLDALARFMRYVSPVDPELVHGLLRGPTSGQVKF